jgi:hypothetical protein
MSFINSETELPMRVMKHRTRKTWGVSIELHTLLLNGSKWPSSHPSHFTLGEEHITC